MSKKMKKEEASQEMAPPAQAVPIGPPGPPPVNCRIEIDIVNSNIKYKVLTPDGQRITFITLQEVFLKLANFQQERLLQKAQETGAIFHVNPEDQPPATPPGVPPGAIPVMPGQPPQG